MAREATVSPFSTSMRKASSSSPIFLSIRIRMTIPRPAPSEVSSTVAKASSMELKARERAMRSKMRICSVLVISTLLRTEMVKLRSLAWNTTLM